MFDLLLTLSQVYEFNFSNNLSKHFCVFLEKSLQHFEQEESNLRAKSPQVTNFYHLMLYKFCFTLDAVVSLKYIFTYKPTIPNNTNKKLRHYLCQISEMRTVIRYTQQNNNQQTYLLIIVNDNANIVNVFV